MGKNRDEPEVVLNCQGGESWPPLASIILQGHIECILDNDGEAITVDGVFDMNMTTGLIKSYEKTEAGGFVVRDRKRVVNVLQAAGPLSLQVPNGEVVSEYRIRQAFDGLMNSLDVFCGMLQIERETACNKLTRLLQSGFGKDLEKLINEVLQISRQ